MFDTIVKIILTLAVAGILIGLLPVSPFTSVIEGLGTLPFLAELNWFFPVSRILSVTYAWGAAVLAFYAISWILRQLGIID